jgi:hypothetical protein
MQRIMRMATVAVLVIVMLAGSVSPASAGDYYYAPYSAANYGYGNYAPGYTNNDHPFLRNLAIGAGLVGVGFLAGRLTAPRPYSYGYGPSYGYAPNNYGHYWHW